MQAKRLAREREKRAEHLQKPRPEPGRQTGPKSARRERRATDEMIRPHTTNWPPPAEAGRHGQAKGEMEHEKAQHLKSQSHPEAQTGEQSGGASTNRLLAPTTKAPPGTARHRLTSHLKKKAT